VSQPDPAGTGGRAGGPGAQQAAHQQQADGQQQPGDQQVVTAVARRAIVIGMVMVAPQSGGMRSSRDSSRAC
jgi:hypothetical protein